MAMASMTFWTWIRTRRASDAGGYNLNGLRDPGESDPARLTTDATCERPDELSAGTDPQNAADYPRAHGNFVFVEHYGEAPDPPMT